MRSAVAIFVLCPLISLPAAAQPHTMAHRTLFTARASPADVVPRLDVRSDATATGAFIISADAKTVSYRLTWDRLRSAKIEAIDLHNFARGGVGKSVATLCGRGANACPQKAGGTIEGTWEIPPPLTRELGVMRIYADIHTSAAKESEFRGQVEPLPWMVHSEQWVAKLDDGTGTLYITPFPDGTQIQFDVTVVGLPDDAGVSIGKTTLRGERHGSTISGVMKGEGVTSRLLSAIRSGAKLTVVSKGKAVASGTLAPVM